MSTLSIISFSIFLFLFATFFRKNTDIFSPARIFALIWFLAIGVTELKLSRFQYEWSPYSWMLLSISLLSMFCGMFIVYVINIGNPVKEVSSIRAFIKNQIYDTSKLFHYTLYIFIAYIISFIVTYLFLGFLPIFTKNPAVTKGEWGVFGFGLFVQSFPTVCYLIILYLILEKKETKKRMLLLICLAVAFLSYMSLLQRYYVIFPIILIAITSYYSTKVFRTRNVVIFFGTIALIFVGFSKIRLSGVVVNILYYISKMKYSVKYAVFTEPYMYLSMNLENFSNAVARLEKYSYGTYTFDFIFALTGLKYSLKQYLSLPEYPHLLTNNYNTYTMFFIFYRDFGIIGLGLIPFLLGLVFSSAYYKMRREPNLNSVAVYSICLFVIMLSFFVPIITFLHFVFNFILIYFFTNNIFKTSKV